MKTQVLSCLHSLVKKDISRNWRSKGLRGIRSLRNSISIEMNGRIRKTAEKKLILTSCSRICNVGTS